jgi:hypothetical protein
MCVCDFGLIARFHRVRASCAGGPSKAPRPSNLRDSVEVVSSILGAKTGSVVWDQVTPQARADVWATAVDLGEETLDHRITPIRTAARPTGSGRVIAPL